MSVAGKRTIYVGPVDSYNGKPLIVEGVAVDANVLPGTLMKLTAAGLDVSEDAATVHGEPVLIADRDKLAQAPIDQAWRQGETMQAVQLRSGEFANVLVAPGQNIQRRGTPLVRNGSGLLQTGNGANTQDAICFADEIINTTGGPATGTLVRVRAR